jgi:hypothetical protein
MVASTKVLYDWKFETAYNGSLYLTGKLWCGKEWETSNVWKLETLSDHYRVTTNYSVYELYW